MEKYKLSNIATRAPGKLNKDKIKKQTQKLCLRLGELQNLLYAEGKHALLVVLQGMDASGKDGAVKHVFDSVNPQGCNVTSFKSPNELELKHDFLWRIHHNVPARGMIQLFNRSHYEEVIIQRVHKWVDERTIRNRFNMINDFEKMLIQNGTLILKFYLHISKDEQLKRLQERMSDPTKMWKHNENDLKERDFWNNYMSAYSDAFTHCSKHAEWHVVPSDQNWYKEHIIAKKVVETLEALKMKYPGLKKS